MRPICVLLAIPVLLLQAADKKRGPVVAEGSNDKVAVSATLYNDKDAIRGELGSDLGGYFTLVKVEITPKGAKPLAISHDDFVLRTYNDGQKCGAFEPSQVAGRGVLVVSNQGNGGGLMSESTGPSWGGMGGWGRRSPGMGNAGAPTSTQATVSDTGKDDPVLTILKQRMLPDKETADPLSGLLYFSLEGKHKPKDYGLQYIGPAGKLTLEFK